jgi:hypothetical protein
MGISFNGNGRDRDGKRRGSKKEQRRKSTLLNLESLERRELLTGPGDEGPPGWTPSTPVVSDVKNGPLAKGGWELISIYQEYQVFRAGGGGTNFQSSFRDRVFFDGNRVGVTIYAYGALDTYITQAQMIGLSVVSTSPAARMIEGYILPDKLVQLAQLSNTIGLAAMARPITHSQGVANNQAEQAMQVAQARTQFGVDGTGITVGVLSDSVNRFQGGLADSIATGDLPPLSRINVLADEPAGGSNSDEGRAMMELIYDMAPGVNLAYHTAFTGQGNFAQGIRDLSRVAGAQVIVDDVSYRDEPYFQDGVIAQAVTDVVRNDNRLYFSSAGNQANQGLQTPFRGVQTTIAGITGSFLDFDPGPGQVFRLPIRVNVPGQIVFQFDQPFFTTNGVVSDVDFLVLDANGNNVLVGGNNNNIATQQPLEVGIVTAAGDYTLAAVVRQGPDPSLVRWRIFGSDVDFNLQTFAGMTYPTTAGHNASADAFSTGAVAFFNAPPFSTTLPVRNNDFSSHGPVSIVFDPQGNRILGGPIVLNKPDFSGIDGVNTTFFPPGGDIPQDPDSFPNFFGTSAAAPNLAAVAALMRQLSPGLNKQDAFDAFRSSVIPLNGSTVPNWDVQGGYGLVQAVASLQAVDRLRVSSVTPASGTVLNTGLNTLVFTFNRPINPATIQASDLVFTSIPSGVTIERGTPIFNPAVPTRVEFPFTISAPLFTTANGTYQYTLNDGSLAATDGRLLAAFTGTFTINDFVAPRITNVVTSNRLITISFSEPMNPATLTKDTIKLIRANNALGVFDSPTNIVLTDDPRVTLTRNASNTAVTIDLRLLDQSNLPSDWYQVRVLDSARDIVGNRLDGEFAPVGGVFPSGNGTAGGNFIYPLGRVNLTPPNILSFGLAPESDSGIPGDDNTRFDGSPGNPLEFVGRVSAAFPGTVAGLTVVAQFNALNGGTFSLQQGPGGIGFVGGFNVQTTTDENGNFRFAVPSVLADGFHRVRVVVVGASDQPALPGLSSLTEKGFRVDKTLPLLRPNPSSVQPGTNISSLVNGILLDVEDPVLPNSITSFLAVPTSFVVPALDPNRANNVSNYALIEKGADGQYGTGDDLDFSNFIASATFRVTTARTSSIQPYRGQIELRFNNGLPEGRYVLVARTSTGGNTGITDAAGNPLDGDTSTPGADDFLFEFNFQPTPAFITRWDAVSPDPITGQSIFSGPRSYFEIPSPGQDPRAAAPPESFIIEFSNALPDRGAGYYNNFVKLVRTANSSTAGYDGDFGTDSTFVTPGAWSAVPGLTVTLSQSVLGSGKQDRLTISLPPGTRLAADSYRLYIPNAIMPDGTDLRIFDVFGNQLDGEFLGNPTALGTYETLLPTGAMRTGLSGDGTPGGAFTTGFLVVPNSNVLFARPDYRDDPTLPDDDPDGSPQKPYAALAPEVDPARTDLHGGDLNSSTNFSLPPELILDRNGNGRYDRSAFFAAQQRARATQGPVVLVALPALDPTSAKTFVLQAPSGADPIKNDGSASVPESTMLVFQPGSILKLRNASLYVQNQGSSLQMRGGPNLNQKVFVTSFNDDSVGGDTNGNGSDPTTAPNGGDWGGIVLRNFNDTAFGGRPIPVAPGPVDPTRPRLGVSGADDGLSYMNFTNVSYGGGVVPSTLGYRFDAITLFASRPMLSNMTISSSGGQSASQAAISVDVDSLREDDLARGLLARRITLGNNSLNGILVRAELPGVAKPTDALFLTDNPPSRGGQQNYTFDDPLPYLFTSRLEIGSTLRHNTGGATRPNTARFYIQPGMLLKFQRGAAIDVVNRNASINIGDRTYINQYDRTPNIAAGDVGFRPPTTGDARVILTSIYDDAATTFYVNPNTGAQTTIVPPLDSDNGGSFLQPTPGNVPALARWGGISVLAGAIAVIDEAIFQYGGGSVNTANGTIDQRDVLAFYGAEGVGRSAFGTTVNAPGTRAWITNNDFFDNREAPISVEPDGLLAADPLRPLQSGNPFFRNNVMQRNDINGLEVIPDLQNRNGTTFIGRVQNLYVDSVWDDTDLTYVLRTTIALNGLSFFGQQVPAPGTSFEAQLKAYVTLTLQSNLPDTLLADGSRIARPGESLLIKLLNDFTVPPVGDGVNGMPNAVEGDTRAGAGFIVGADDTIDPDTDPTLDAGMMSQLRILGIGGNETTGQQRVPVIMTSLRDNTVGKTVRGVDMFNAVTTQYLQTLPGLPGGPNAGPQPGDAGVILFGANSLSDYNLWDPRDGNLIDNADIRYLTRIEQQGGGWSILDAGAGNYRRQKTGITPSTQYNTAKAMTISNSNFANFSQIGFIAHPSGAAALDLVIAGGFSSVARNQNGWIGQPTLTLLLNNTFANMPGAIRINGPTTNDDTFQSPSEALIMNNTFYNVGVGIETSAAAWNNQNAFSHVYFLAMNNIFANVNTVGVRVTGQGTGSQLQYNLFSGVPNPVDVSASQFVRFPFNAQPIFGTARFRDPLTYQFQLTADSDGIDAARSEIGPMNLGISMQPIVNQQLNATGGIRRSTGRNNIFGGLVDVSQPGDNISLPGLPPNIRGFVDQWVPARPGTPGAIPGPSSNAGNTFSYTPMEGERDQVGFLRVDDPGKANVGFGSRPFFDIGAFEYRPISPPKIIDVVATISDPVTGAPITAPIYRENDTLGTNQTPRNLVITFNRRIDPLTINNLTFLLQASGGDGIFENGNSAQDRFIELSGKLVYDAATRRAFINLKDSNLELGSDLYRLTIRGSGGQVVRDESGTPLDGENTVGNSPTGAPLALPSGDNIQGGNFYLVFAVDTNAPAIVAGTLQLAATSITSPVSNVITNQSRPTFVGRITDVVPPINPLLNQTILLDVDINGDGVFANVDTNGDGTPDIIELGLGTATTDAAGNFSVRPTAALPDSNPKAGPDNILGTADDTNYTLVRVRAIDQSGNVSPDNENARMRVLIDTKGPRVTGTSPLSGALVSPVAGSVSVAINFNETVLRQNIDTSTIQVFRAGLDGVFGTGDDVAMTVDAASIRLTPLGGDSGPMKLEFNIIGVTASDQYRIKLLGTGSRTIIDVASNALDGEFNGTFPSGDGTPGGDFDLTFIVLAPAGGNTIYVSQTTGSAGGTGRRNSPFQTINQGLAVALPGDTVAVIGGNSSSRAIIYTESINMKSLVSIVSADPRSTDAELIKGDALKTVIRPAAGSSTFVVSANNLLSVDSFRTRLEGFTIMSPLTGGSQTGAIVPGSIGVVVNNSDIDIARNIIVNADRGIDVRLPAGSARTPRVLSNLINGNVNGIFVTDTGSTEFAANRNVQLYNNTIVFNTAGITLDATTGNRAIADIANNIFWQNAQKSAARTGAAVIGLDANLATIRYNLFSANGPSVTSPADDTTGSFAGFNPALLTTRPDALGNFTASNPGFVRSIDARPNASGPGNFLAGANFDLKSTSAAIDVALNSLAPELDLLQRRRVDIAGKGRPGVGPADLGAYEFRGTSTIPIIPSRRPRTGRR